MFLYHMLLVKIFYCTPPTLSPPPHPSKKKNTAVTLSLHTTAITLSLHFFLASGSDETVNSGNGQYTSGSQQMGWTGSYKDHQHFYGRKIQLSRAFSTEYKQLQENVMGIVGGKPLWGETCVKFLCHHSGIQGRMQLTQSKDAIVLAVRRSKKDAGEIKNCQELLDTILAAIEHFLCDKRVLYSIKFLSPMSLKHLHETKVIDMSKAIDYNYEDLDRAEGGVLVNNELQVHENIFDILCQGFDTRYITLNGQDCDVLWLPDKTLELLSTLDKKKASKEDYQSLGKAIGFNTAEMDKIKQSCTVNGLSITEKLLSDWPKNGVVDSSRICPKRTIGNLRTILRVVIGNDYADKLDQVLQEHKHQVSH